MKFNLKCIEIIGKNALLITNYRYSKKNSETFVTIL